MLAPTRFYLTYSGVPDRRLTSIVLEQRAPTLSSLSLLEGCCRPVNAVLGQQVAIASGAWGWEGLGGLDRLFAAHQEREEAAERLNCVL